MSFTDRSLAGFLRKPGKLGYTADRMACIAISSSPATPSGLPAAEIARETFGTKSPG
jgi:hypothetical protein